MHIEQRFHVSREIIFRCAVFFFCEEKSPRRECFPLCDDYVNGLDGGANIFEKQLISNARLLLRNSRDLSIALGETR